MARKKLYGAALAAHQKKARKGSAKRHKNRVRHQVKHHKRKGGAVKSYRRKGSAVKAHWSNPYGRKRRSAKRSYRRSYRRSRRNPFSLGAAGSTTVNGLIAAGVLFGTLFVVGFANRQAERVPALQTGWGNLAAKLAIALAGSFAAAKAAQKGYLKGSAAAVAGAAAWAPLGLGLLATFAPQVAGQISLAGAQDEGFDLGMTAGPRLPDYTMDAELKAELQDEGDDIDAELAGPMHETEAGAY